jgi:hypothetical protein
MTTVQIVGVAVAAAVVVLLVIALLVTRRRGRGSEAPPGTSFLDAAPQDTLAGLGRAEVPVEDVTLDPEAVRSLKNGRPAEAPPAASAREDDTLVPPELVPPEPEPPELVPPDSPVEPVTVPAAARDDEGERPLSLDWGPPAQERTLASAEGAGLEAAGLAAGFAAAAPGQDAPDPSATPSGASSGEPADQAGSPTGAQRPSRKVPLADIIVTTSRKVIDLEDPEVRRMLTDLVKFEIDQATRYREQGQTIDAVLQLTEAEKISRALGMKASADAIRLMMEDLRT